MGNILFYDLEEYGLIGRVWAFPFPQVRVLDLTSRASVWAVLEGHGCGMEPIAFWAGEWNTCPISLSPSIIILIMVSILNEIRCI